MNIIARAFYSFVGLTVRPDGTGHFSGRTSFDLNEMDTKWLKVFLISKFTKPLIWICAMIMPAIANLNAGFLEVAFVVIYFVSVLFLRRIFVRKDVKMAYAKSESLKDNRPFRLNELGAFSAKAEGLTDNGITFFVKRFGLISKFYLPEMPQSISEPAYADALEASSLITLFVACPIALLCIVAAFLLPTNFKLLFYLCAFVFGYVLFSILKNKILLETLRS